MDIIHQLIAHAPTFVPDSIALDDLLRVFDEKKTHFAILVEEHGGVKKATPNEWLASHGAGEAVALHGLPRLRHRVGVDRLQYLLVFFLKRVKLDTTSGRGRPIPD